MFTQFVNECRKPKHTHVCLLRDSTQTHTPLSRGPTDVVVLVPGPELEAQREGSEELELLREAQGPVWTSGTVAFPAFEATHPVLARSVALVVDHEQDVALHAAVGRKALVERTVNVQIVVDVHRHPVFSMPEPARHQK